MNPAVTAVYRDEAGRIGLGIARLHQLLEAPHAPEALLKASKIAREQILRLGALPIADAAVRGRILVVLEGIERAPSDDRETLEKLGEAVCACQRLCPGR
ncbi:MAG: hypothetical protein ABFE16_02775 [Armatimonadia bacterium]